MNIENVRLDDGLNRREIRTLKRLSSSEIISKLGGKEKLVKNILDRYYNFDKLLDKGKIASIYKKAKRNPSFAAMVQLYLKIKGKYNAKIDGDFGRKSLNALQALTKRVDVSEKKEYESILRLEKMKAALRLGKVLIGKYRLTYKKLLSYKKRGINKIKLRYSGVKYDWVKVSDAIQLYKDMIRAGEISIRVDSAGVKNAKGYQYNEEAARAVAEKEYKESKNLSPLTALTLISSKFIGLREGQKKFISLNRKRFSYKAPYEAWCGHFVSHMLDIAIKSGKLSSKSISSLRSSLRNVRNKNVAASYFGLDKLSGSNRITTGLHIMISDGHGNLIGGNTRGKVSKIYRGDNYKCWIHPNDMGNPNKIHWRRKGEIPPAGALVIPWARDKKVRPKLAKLAGGRYSHHERKTYASARRTRTHRRTSPLDILNGRG